MHVVLNLVRELLPYSTAHGFQKQQQQQQQQQNYIPKIFGKDGLT